MPTDQNTPDIFFDDTFCQLYAQREGFPYERIQYEDKNGCVIYPLMKREIVINGNKTGYVDILTPHAFGGPVICQLNQEENRGDLLRSFNSYFNDYCDREKIVAEYVQFNPWLKNHLDFMDEYNVSLHNKTYAIDLNVGDFFMKEFAGRRRTSVRFAIKSGVEVVIDEDGDSIDDFIRLYDFTIERHNIKEYFILSKEFLNEMFHQLKGNIISFWGKYEGKCISVNIFFIYKNKIHFIYAANDPEYFRLNASSLLIYKAACYAQERGCILMNLGGGGTEQSKLFKESFTKNSVYDYFTGTKIRNLDIYNDLTKQHGASTSNFFPAYRAPK